MKIRLQCLFVGIGFLCGFFIGTAHAAVLFGINCAVQTEADPIIKSMVDTKLVKRNNFKFITGIIAGKSVVLIVGGVGSINATIATAELIRYFNSSYLLFSGSAGRVDNRLNIGDVVLARSIYDLDYGNPDSNIPKISFSQINLRRDIAEPLFFKGSQELLNLYPKIQAGDHLKAAHDEMNKRRSAKVVIGYAASSDHFPNNDQDAKRMSYNGVKAVAMEGYAFMKTCWVFQKECLVVRGISNAIGTSVKSPFLVWNKEDAALAENNAGQTVVNIVSSFDKRPNESKYLK